MCAEKKSLANLLHFERIDYSRVHQCWMMSECLDGPLPIKWKMLNAKRQYSIVFVNDLINNIAKFRLVCHNFYLHIVYIMYIRILEQCKSLHCKKKLWDSWICFDQTFQGLGLGQLFPARESLLCDIQAGDGKSLDLYLQCIGLFYRGCRSGSGSACILLLDSDPDPKSCQNWTWTMKKV